MSTIIESTFQSDWFMHTLSNHIPPIQFYNLKYVSKTLNKIIDDDFICQLTIQIMTNRLLPIFKEHYNTFIQFIKTNNIVISGSFLIQCLLNEKYPQSDIDLYDYQGTSITDETINFLDPNAKYNKSCHSPKSYKMPDAYDYSISISDIKTINIDNVPIQIIVITVYLKKMGH
jgi:hypothetical protein